VQHATRFLSTHRNDACPRKRTIRSRPQNTVALLDRTIETRRSDSPAAGKTEHPPEAILYCKQAFLLRPWERVTAESACRDHTWRRWHSKHGRRSRSILTDIDDNLRICIADCMRECREPSAGSRCSTKSRDVCKDCVGSLP